MPNESLSPQSQEKEPHELPEAGPEYLISETGFGPTGVQESRSDDTEKPPKWKLWKRVH